MMFSMPYEQHVASPEVVEALNLILILHADHEQNCSTSTVRIVGSSQANLFASCAAGVCALWGPLHGGANVAVLEMLEEIHDGGLTAEQAHRAGQGQEERVPAHGLRPPRLQELRPAGRDPQAGRRQGARPSSASRTRCSTSPGSSRSWPSRTPTSSTASSIPNVDFYSGIIMRAIGIPTNMFTVIFAIGRMPGWIAHWKEQHDDRQAGSPAPGRSTPGRRETDYVPIEKR